MVASHGELNYTVMQDGARVLMKPYDVFMDGVVWRVPSGFITDGASIPKALWRVAGHPFEVPRLYAAVLHDYFYATHKVPREFADKAFRDLQRCWGRGKFVTAVEYRALRMFGGSHWGNEEEK